MRIIDGPRGAGSGYRDGIAPGHRIGMGRIRIVPSGYVRRRRCIIPIYVAVKRVPGDKRHRDALARGSRRALYLEASHYEFLSSYVSTTGLFLFFSSAIEIRAIGHQTSGNPLADTK